MSQNFLSIYAKSFNWAGFFLPKELYKSSSDLYDFCRTLDDIADQNLELENKKEKFEKFKNQFKNKNLENSIIKKIYNLIENFEISPNIILDLFDGVESDLKEKVKFNSVKELIVYSYRVAGTVGLMMAKILKVNSKSSLRAAIDLGIAIEDQKMNREYIKPNFENIEATLKLADMFYESSFSSIKKIPFKYRFAIIVARRVYRQIGRKIIQKRSMESYKKSGKIYVNNLGKIYQTILSLFDLMLLYLKDEESHQRIREHEIISEEVNLNERI